MERSPENFHKFKDRYVHTFKNVSDSGINLNLLQNFIFIPIDIFLEKLHNEGVNTDFDAWMTFLGCDEPEYIIKLISKYPKFIPIYESLYNICRNIEGVMNMFSEELTILDRNTVTYMIDELQAEVADKDAVIADKDAQLANKDAQLTEAQRQIAELTKKLQESQH